MNYTWKTTIGGLPSYPVILILIAVNGEKHFSFSDTRANFLWKTTIGGLPSYPGADNTYFYSGATALLHHKLGKNWYVTFYCIYSGLLIFFSLL